MGLHDPKKDQTDQGPCDLVTFLEFSILNICVRWPVSESNKDN